MQTQTHSAPDPAYDILRSDRQPLDFIFAPKSVAVIGATERQGSVGRTLLWNLVSSSFGGTIFPVNPQRNSVLGIKAYPSIADVPDPVDLAVIVTPAKTVPDIIRQCADVGVKGAIVLSAGFKETGAAGIELEQQLLDHVRRSKMRLIGPNCLGVMNPISGLNATFASKMARPGNVGFISQSGALCTAILDWSFQENVGFSSFISIGSMLDVDWGDLIYYLGDDPNTQSIVLYMESIGNARSFLSAAREVALTKPIIVIKAGRTEAAAKAAASHTGALTGSEAVLEAAFRRCGVLSVNRISDLFDMAEVLAKQPRPKGPRLTLITNAGGPGVLATDALIATGGELADLTEEAKTSLNSFLPTHWSHNNPVDILGDADATRYAKTLEVLAQDSNSDGVLVILTPQAVTEPVKTAELLKSYAKIAGKPILASWMGGSDIEHGEAILNSVSIPTYRYPDAAARVFSLMWRSSYNLQGIYETPVLPADADFTPDRTLVRQIIDTAHREDRTILTEYESKQLLMAYGIPTVETYIAASEAEALQQAEAIGYPVVLKLYSKTITHKTDVGGVQLNLKDAEAVRQAYRAIASTVAERAGAEHFDGVTVQPMLKLDGYEIIIGSNLDPQFGPVLLFGSGGQLVEVFQDSAIALPPLNTTLARRLMEQTQIYKALKGVRGRSAVDLPGLEQLLVRFSQLIVEQRWIQEIDINPLLVKPLDSGSSQPLTALDARVVIHPKGTHAEDLPKLAIRPYPIQYVSEWTLRDDTPVTIRPIRPEDEPLLRQFHQTLSERSIYLRYFHMVKLSQRTTHDRLMRLCFIDYDREMALVAEHHDPETNTKEVWGVARLSKLHGNNEAEFAMLVSDQYQCKGLGTELLRRLIQVGRDERLERINAEVLGENTGMQHVCEKLGFRIKRTADPTVVRAELIL
ncbi:bifunctional acetate--CoA ligase family protein/GNAT family N-acetyltransferase [Oscillatoria sp. FACHB-1407]|uniref:bifunctional acetate--CoA ligase family protein/GNAT family N-acetyltransferase n=1 Tax=Oscillatoria sp. FACHB-1407 TaxID=2692847 RepID=UPI001683F4C9|nr:bifunctional acetate--CoA ligase family protein/GNAT family N-acetyltransferase [Oscillatoria sp. FACHB-1407]MBD2461461.1 bifunctional acetate--CoA ligase family protein/GNAT family N-acetyltransferase [Oscillatoria sp. FACHB-1407]